MRKVYYAVFFLFLISPLLSPVFAFAESDASAVASRYCPDPAKDFFKGSIYHENGKPWVETIVDPDFADKTLRIERHITGNIPLTPVYDLVVRIKPEFNYYCIPGWVEGTPVTTEKLPLSLGVGGILVFGEHGNKKMSEIVNFLTETTYFLRTEKKDEHNRFIYEWKIKGWPNGVSSGAKMDKLIEAIGKNEPVDVMLEVSNGGGVTQEIKSVSFELCAPLWGSGEHKAVLMRGRSGPRDFSYFINKASQDIDKGFRAIEPYKTYSERLSFVLDLVNYDDEWLQKLFKSFFGKLNLKQPTPENLASRSCGGGFHLLYTSYFQKPEQLGIAFIARQSAIIHWQSRPKVTVHEFSHLFADLNDEYSYGAGALLPLSFHFRNCSRNPAVDYVYQGKRYGSTRYQGCSQQFGAYRPSITSMMDNESDVAGEGSFNNLVNTISCGYIVGTFYSGRPVSRGEAAKYWPECAAMKGIATETEGVTAQNIFSSMFAWIGNIFSLPSSLPAQIGSAAPDEPQSDYMIIESFDPNNSWGEIIEVVPDSQSVPISPTPSVLPPPSNISDVTDDSIFDTVSVDLKVNGQDGPIEVERRNRIVLSWISEGATRCRGVWSKNDIKLSGTATGRITRPVTIKIACINTDGERADDEVRVNIAE